MPLFPGQCAYGVPPFGAFEVAAVGLVLAVTLASAAGCGFAWCPDTPVHYQLLYRPS